MQKISVWGVVENGGDGSVYIRWFHSESEALAYDENQPECWGDPSVFVVETYVGSNVYNKAFENKGS